MSIVSKRSHKSWSNADTLETIPRSLMNFFYLQQLPSSVDKCSGLEDCDRASPSINFSILVVEILTGITNTATKSDLQSEQNAVEYDNLTPLEHGKLGM